MASVWLRHPRYSLLLLVTLITTFYLLFVPHGGPTYVQDSLETRVRRSHKIYEKFLVQRQGLIEKWGPDPNDISLYTVLFAFMKAASD